MPFPVLFTFGPNIPTADWLEIFPEFQSHDINFVHSPSLRGFIHTSLLSREYPKHRCFGMQYLKKHLLHKWYVVTSALFKVKIVEKICFVHHFVFTYDSSLICLLNKFQDYHLFVLYFSVGSVI